MGRVLATFATILILVLGAAFAVPAFTDWNSYRPDIEQAASAILGRNVQIRGGIEIALLPEPHFRAGKVAAENGAGDSAYMTADAVDLTLSLQALLGGRLEASKLKLLRPALTLDFSKPLPEPRRAEAGEIEDGGILVLPKHGGASGALILTKIDGTVSAAPPGDSYRFSGRFSQKDRRFEAKFLAAAAAGKGIKLNGSATDLASKAVFQADGMLSAPGEPVFQGSLTIHAPLEQGRLRETPFDVQLKSAAKIGLSEAALDDLTLTIDPQNRPQVLLGSANIAFGAKTAFNPQPIISSGFIPISPYGCPSRPAISSSKANPVRTFRFTGHARRSAGCSRKRRRPCPAKARSGWQAP
ncbi:MAG: AsmA family protein [Rhodomicrobium sp.]|nr:AsmA family protein [Rhodomicrobium sp.]